MTQRMNRRRWLTLCGTGAAVSLTGCVGGDNGGTENGDSSDTDTNGDDSSGNSEMKEGNGITIRHNTQTGRYVFEGGYAEALEDGGEPDRFIWDVQSLDGYDATVEATFIEDSVFGDEESMSLTASPDAPEASLTDPYQIGDGYDISELLSTRMVERWFPNYAFGDLDLGTLDVGVEVDGGMGVSFDVVGTETYAGIEGYVLEEWLVDEEYLGNYCLSPEHAMVIAGEQYDEYIDGVRYRLELVEYEQ